MNTHSKFLLSNYPRPNRVNASFLRKDDSCFLVDKYFSTSLLHCQWFSNDVGNDFLQACSDCWSRLDLFTAPNCKNIRPKFGKKCSSSVYITMIVYHDIIVDMYVCPANMITDRPVGIHEDGIFVGFIFKVNSKKKKKKEEP